MGTILIYDWDYFHYQKVVPNLECAKLAAYEKANKNITVFSNQLIPDKYTKTYIRKEYDDGIYSSKLLLPNVEYGGRAFSEIYKPFNLKCENIVPDFSIYEKYLNLYGNSDQVKTILYATHVRLSLDGKTLEEFPYERLQISHPNIVLHDYDIASIPNAAELLIDICNSRSKNLKFRIGNKYPIQVYSFNQLKYWLQITPFTSLFFIQYNGVFTDEELIELIENYSTALPLILYNFTYNCANETEFMIKVLPNFYRQCVFLRRSKKKFLLNIDEKFFKTKELFNLMCIIRNYSQQNYNARFQIRTQTLFSYCASEKMMYLTLKPWYSCSITRENMRESFQYMRIHNYEVFDMFYSLPSVIIRGGKLVNEYE